MLRRFVYWLLALAVLASACGGQTAAARTSTPTPRQPGPAALAVTPTPALTSTPLPAPNGCRTYRSTQAAIIDATGPLLAGDWVLGPEHPAITLVVYGDYQCAACAALAPVLTQLAQDFPQDLRIVYRHFPLVGTADHPMHDKAALAVQAAEAAGKQDKFWQMHAYLYARQADWASLDLVGFQAWLVQAAAQLALDGAQFTTDLNSPALVKLAADAWQNGLTLGLPEPPVVFLNGKYSDYSLSYWNLAAVIRLTLLGRDQYATCPPLAIDPLIHYLATLKTEKGEIVLELFTDRAPLAVNNFVFLARQGWYKNLTFHRVLPGFIAQSGDPSGTGFGGPGYAFDNETAPGLKFDRPGLLAMANAGPNTNGSQFFITYAAAPELDGKYTIFGQVISGMDVLAQLTPRNPDLNADLPPGDKILQISIEER